MQAPSCATVHLASLFYLPSLARRQSSSHWTLFSLPSERFRRLFVGRGASWFAATVFCCRSQSLFGVLCNCVLLPISITFRRSVTNRTVFETVIIPLVSFVCFTNNVIAFDITNFIIITIIISTHFLIPLQLLLLPAQPVSHWHQLLRFRIRPNRKANKNIFQHSNLKFQNSNTENLFSPLKHPPYVIFTPCSIPAVNPSRCLAKAACKASC